MFDNKQNGLYLKIKIFFENYCIKKRVCKNTLSSSNELSSNSMLNTLIQTYEFRKIYSYAGEKASQKKASSGKAQF